MIMKWVTRNSHKIIAVFGIVSMTIFLLLLFIRCYEAIYNIKIL